MLFVAAAVNTFNVDADVVLVVVSHPLHVLSHPPGATRVSHKLLAKTAWHIDSCSVFVLLSQRSVVVVRVAVVLVENVLVVLVANSNDVEAFVFVLVEVMSVVVLVLELVEVEVLLVVVSHPLHVLSHCPGTRAHNP